MARIIVKLKNTKTLPVKTLLREYLRNFIYDCLRGTKWSFYHDKPNYKHFNFSNIFPFNQEGNITSDFNFIISSPYEELIRLIREQIESIGYVQIGTEKFEVISCKLIPSPKSLVHLKCATPIVLRFKLPESYKDVKNKNDFKFWTENENLKIFLDQIEVNIRKRYLNFLEESKMIGVRHTNPTNIDNIEKIIVACRFKKTIFAWDKHFIGTLWDFEINPLLQNTHFLHYIFETGLGEKNSSGSGFLNVNEHETNK